MKPAAASARAEWICYVASGLPGILLAFLAAAGFVPESIALVLFSLSFVGLNLAHMAATWSRVYLDLSGVRGAVLERIAVPAVLCVSAILGEAVGFGIALFGLQYYLSLHHAMMQNYGLLRAVQRRSGRRFSPRASRIDQAACLLLPLGALAYRAREVCRTYSTAPLATPPFFLVVALLAA